MWPGQHALHPNGWAKALCHVGLRPTCCFAGAKHEQLPRLFRQDVLELWSCHGEVSLKNFQSTSYQLQSTCFFVLSRERRVLMDYSMSFYVLFFCHILVILCGFEIYPTMTGPWIMQRHETPCNAQQTCNQKIIPRCLYWINAASGQWFRSI